MDATFEAARPELPPELQLGYSVARLARLVAHSHTARLGQLLGLGLAEWRLLLMLNRERQTRFDAAAEASLIEKSQASIAARNLERRGLIRRAPDSRDGRRVWFKRTAEGDRLVNSYLAETAASSRALWGQLTEAQQATMLKWLARLIAAAERQETSPPPASQQARKRRVD
ncbi:MAG: MarR family transcriptional regulator [Steroidobacteraceae bacterium]|jgi:DNA-binding MarR family transcriptional regulator|nr:MarR family transcriptional regulator [Steroidobacteraceae bacterium]